MPRIQVDEALQGCVTIILEFVLGTHPFPDIRHLFDHVGHDVGHRRLIALQRHVHRVYILLVLFFIRCGKLLDLQHFRLGAPLLFLLAPLPQRQKHVLYLFLEKMDVRVIQNGFHDVPFAIHRIDRRTLGLRNGSDRIGTLGAPHCCLLL